MRLGAAAVRAVVDRATLRAKRTLCTKKEPCYRSLRLTIFLPFAII